MLVCAGEDMEIRAGNALSPEIVRSELPFVCGLFLRGDSTPVEVTYGWGCNVPDGRYFATNHVPPWQLQSWLDRVVREGIYEPGRADLFFGQSGRVTVRLSYEGDIYVRTEIPDVVKACVERWLDHGYRVSRSREPERRGWADVLSVKDVIGAGR